MSHRVSNGFILTDPAIQSLFRLLHQFDDTNGNTKSEVFTDFVTGISASESELNADKTSVTDNLDSKSLLLINCRTLFYSLVGRLPRRTKGSYFIKDGILFH